MADAPAPDPLGCAYQSLYRRYRPQRFADVRGQEHVTRALRNAVRDERVAHAYLFSGPRGTGKTSTARILAMALNCAASVDGEPDGTCESCRAVRAGSSLDVHELDAASNRKLDEMRDLLSRVSLGTAGRWKVYIVDEVHQLTSDAASALLKTLEEPPANVVFVLATTDPQRVLPTIRSRTQHFEFRLLGAEVLGDLLRDVNERAELGLATEAIDLVVRRGHGSARDALSALDQVAAAGEVDDDVGPVGAIVDAVAERDPGAILVATAEAVRAGRDPRRLAVDLLEHLRNGFLATQARSLVLLPDDAVAEVESQARRIGLPGIVRALDVVGKALVDMRDAIEPRITLEAALVRLAAPGTGPGDLAERVEVLERRLAEGQRVAATAPSAPLPAHPTASPTTSGAPAAAPGRQAPPGPLPGSSGLRSTGDAPPMPRRPSSSAPRTSSAPAPEAQGPEAQGPEAQGPEAQASERHASERQGVVGSPAPDRAPAAPPRAALGAHRRGGPPAGGPGPRQGPGAPSVASPGTAAPPPSSGPRPAGGRPPSPGAAPPDDRTAGPPGSLPSRDELTKAWGDQVLPGLQGALKAYVASGRFVSVDDGSAVFALPDRGLLTRAEPLKPQLEAAIAAHFGRPVPLRLVVDGEIAPLDRSQEAVPDEEIGSEELGQLEDAGPGLVSPEQRLLEAFPGAEEVSP